MLKFYPDHVPARVPRVFGDMFITLWVVAWALCGFAVYQIVEGLQAVSDGVTGTGRTLDAWIDSFRHAVPRSVPGLSSFLTGLADGLQRNSGDQLISFGNQARQTIDHMAIAFGLVTAVPPILIVGGTYLFWRWRDAREMGAALAFVVAAERSGRLEQAKAVLAYRAVAQLRFTELMKASADPIGDLAAHQYDGLAAAMLKRAGLNSFRLHDRGAARLSESAAPASTEIGDAGQDDHQRRRHSQGQVGRLGPGDERG